MACQVFVLVYDPPHPAVELSLSSTIEELLHVSEDVGSVNTGVAGHSTVPLDRKSTRLNSSHSQISYAVFCLKKKKKKKNIMQHTRIIYVEDAHNTQNVSS